MTLALALAVAPAVALAPALALATPPFSSQNGLQKAGMGMGELPQSDKASFYAWNAF